jgi:hypothetical protein
VYNTSGKQVGVQENDIVGVLLVVHIFNHSQPFPYFRENGCLDIVEKWQSQISIEGWRRVMYKFFLDHSLQDGRILN